MSNPTAMAGRKQFLHDLRMAVRNSAGVSPWAPPEMETKRGKFGIRKTSVPGKPAFVPPSPPAPPPENYQLVLQREYDRDVERDMVASRARARDAQHQEDINHPTATALEASRQAEAYAAQRDAARRPVRLARRR